MREYKIFEKSNGGRLYRTKVVARNEKRARRKYARRRGVVSKKAARQKFEARYAGRIEA